MQISEETKNKIIELYVNTHKKISKILQEVAPDEKISLEEFYDILREYSDNNPDKSMSRQIKDSKILELLEKGFSRKEIVEKMGISKQSISKRIIQMEERGVEIPKKKKKKIESTGADIARGVIDLMDKKGASEEQVRTIAEIYGVDEEVEDLLKCIDEKER